MNGWSTSPHVNFKKEAYCFVNVIYVMMYIIYYRKISQVLCYKGFRNIIHIKDIEILQTIFLPSTLLRYTYYLYGILIQQRTPMGFFCRRNDTSFIHSIRCLMFKKAFYFVCKRMFLLLSGKYNQYSTVSLSTQPYQQTIYVLKY